MKRKKLISQMLVSVFAMSSVLSGLSPITAYAEGQEETRNTEIQTEFFVSPKGDDAGDGSYEHPFATLEAARDAVRKVNDSMTGDIYVFIAKGDYYVEDTIVFDEQDSGTNGFKIRYVNLDGITDASFIGGRQVDSEWTLAENKGADADLPDSAVGKVYKTHVGTDTIFDTLYVNDERATLARTQNKEQIAGFESALTPLYEDRGRRDQQPGLQER